MTLGEKGMGSPTAIGGRLVTAADVDALDAALGELPAAGWPAPEDADSDDDADLGGRDTIADRLSD